MLRGAGDRSDGAGSGASVDTSFGFGKACVGSIKNRSRKARRPEMAEEKRIIAAGI